MTSKRLASLLTTIKATLEDAEQKQLSDLASNAERCSSHVG